MLHLVTNKKQKITYLDDNSLYPSVILYSIPSNQAYWIESYSEKGLDINSISGVL